MTTNLTETLDIATEQLIAGESIPIILAEYPAHAEALYPLLNTAVMLETIRPVEMPPPEVLQANRDAFLAEVVNLQQQPVSPAPLNRLKEWFVHYLPWNLLNSTHQRKEQRRMNALLIKAVMIFSVVFGSVGGTAVYAAHSLPGSAAYPMKLTMEQARLALTSDPASQANVHLTLAQVRTQEMEQLAQQGIAPDEATLNRLQLHLNQALHLAAQLPEGEMQQLLTQTQQMLQTQEQQLTQTQAQVDEPVQLVLRQANRLLNQVRQEVEVGLQDPQTFRWRYNQSDNPESPCDTDDCAPAQNQNQHQNRSQPEEVPGDCDTDDCEPQQDQNQNQNQNQNQIRSQSEETPSDCDTDDCEPAQNQNQYQHQNQNNSQPEETPGPCDTDDCEPAQNQNQYQHQNQNQNGPQSEDPATPCQSDDCEPIGDEHQYRYGAQPDQPGPGQPGGNPDGCDSGDCEPEGDQHQQGQPPAPPSPPPTPPKNQDGNNGSNDDNGGDGGDQGGDNGGGDQGGSNNGGGSDSSGGDNGGGNDNGGGSNDGGGGDNGGGGGSSDGGGGGGGKK